MRGKAHVTLFCYLMTPDFDGSMSVSVPPEVDFE